MMKKLFYLLFSIVLIGLAGKASAQDKGYGMGDRVFPAIARLLTDDQRKSLQQILESERGKIRPLEEKIRTSRQALLGQITGGNFDENSGKPIRGGIRQGGSRLDGHHGQGPFQNAAAAFGAANRANKRFSAWPLQGITGRSWSCT